MDGRASTSLCAVSDQTRAALQYVATGQKLTRSVGALRGDGRFAARGPRAIGAPRVHKGATYPAPAVEP